MADLKSGYKMMYEKDPIISPATVRDIKATKDTPLLTDKTVVFKEYESEATITRGTFYKVYEKLVDDSIRLYGVKRDDSVVEFAVYSGDDELLIGRKKEVPPVPSPYYLHELKFTGTDSTGQITGPYTVEYLSLSDDTLSEGAISGEEVKNMFSNILGWGILDYQEKDETAPAFFQGFIVEETQTRAEVSLSSTNPYNIGLYVYIYISEINIISDIVK